VGSRLPRTEVPGDKCRDVIGAFQSEALGGERRDLREEVGEVGNLFLHTDRAEAEASFTHGVLLHGVLLLWSCFFEAGKAIGGCS
jgi:hypothetical protein